MSRKYLLAILILIVSVFGKVEAQSFSASIDNTTVGQYEQFQISFTFQGKDINGTSNFKAPSFGSFMVLSGPNQSTSMQIINGAASGSVSYTYYLQPKGVGKYTIGSASIDYDGKTYSSQPLPITVVQGTPPKQNKPSAQNSQSVSANEIGDNLFIRATADRKTVYMGQQVTVSYKLYTRLAIASQMSVNKLPSYEGLWAEEINVPNNITFTTEMVDGKQYRVGLLKKVALFPSQYGELSVTPMVLDIPVQLQQRKKSSGNIFDDFFNDPFFNNYKTVNYTAKSNTIKLNVLPLPSKDVPKSFNGAVGDFSMSSKLSTTQTKTNEPLSLKIDLSGKGNIQLLSMPEVNFPQGFDKFEPKTTEQINRDGTIDGKKTFEYLIVPRTPGKKTIPPIEFSYFNPAKKSYVTLQTPTYNIEVAQGKNIQGGNAAGLTKEEIKVLGQDINYIKTDDNDLFKGSSLAIDSVGFWTATGLPFMLLAGLIVWKKRTDKLNSNLQLLRYQRAEKVAKTRFKTAKTLMEASDQNAFYTEISAALFGYLEDKLHISKSEISLERAVEELNARNIDPSLNNTLKDCIEKCEYARFAPSKDGRAEMNEMYNELTNVIIEIEKSITSKKVV